MKHCIFIILIILLTASLAFSQEEIFIINSENHLEKVDMYTFNREIIESNFDFPTCVTLSPDGDKVAFLYDTTTNDMGYMMGKAGIYSISGKKFYPFEEIEVVFKGGDFSWSPDSKKVATVDVTGSLYILNVPDGIERISRGGGEKIWSPSWMPSGGKIALRSYRENNIGNVILYNINKAKFKDLFTSSFNLGSEYFVPPVTWSPGCNGMCFEVQRDTYPDYEIWYSDIRGERQMIIAEGYWPEWDRGSDNMLFLSSREDTDGDGNINYIDTEIYMIASMSAYLEDFEEYSTFLKEPQNLVDDYIFRISYDRNINGKFLWLPDIMGVIYEVLSESSDDKNEGFCTLKSSLYINYPGETEPGIFLEDAYLVGFKQETSSLDKPLVETGDEEEPIHLFPETRQFLKKNQGILRYRVFLLTVFQRSPSL